MKKKRYPTLLIPFMIPAGMVVAIIFFLVYLVKLLAVLFKMIWDRFALFTFKNHEAFQEDSLSPNIGV